MSSLAVIVRKIWMFQKNWKKVVKNRKKKSLFTLNRPKACKKACKTVPYMYVKLDNPIEIFKAILFHFTLQKVCGSEVFCRQCMLRLRWTALRMARLDICKSFMLYLNHYCTTMDNWTQNLNKFVFGWKSIQKRTSHHRPKF